MKRVLAFLTAVFLLSLLPAGEVFSQHKLESWYFYFGLGYANNQYPDPLDMELDNLADQTGITHVSVGIDFPGIYFRKGERTIIGGVLNISADRFEDDNSSASVQFTEVTVALSAMHFLTKEVGRGLFLRGDVGPARLGVSVEGGGLAVTTSSDWGFGALIGAGYAIPVSRGTRILFNANYAFRRIEGEAFGAFAITLGGLF